MEAAPPAPELLAMFSRLSSSLSPQDIICAFAGGALPHTILSCYHTVLLGMFDTKAVLPLRVTCRDARAAVAGHAWEDRDTVVQGHLGGALLPSVDVSGDDELAALLGPSAPPAQRGAWRACFPRALCANVRGVKFRGYDFFDGEPYRSHKLTGNDFVHLAGVRELDMAQQEPEPALPRSVCSGGLVSLKATLHTLRAAYCDAVTNDVLEALGAEGALRVLDIEGCHQVSEEGLLRLRGLQHLNISGLEDVSAAGLAHLEGTLEALIARRTALTDEAFTQRSWPRLRTLDVSHCHSLTDAIVPHICHVESLAMEGMADGLLDECPAFFLNLLRTYPQSRGICTAACEAVSYAPPPKPPHTSHPSFVFSHTAPRATHALHHSHQLKRCSSEDAEAVPDAVPLVVQALRNHAGASVRTLTAACKALANLAASSAQRQREALGALTGILRQEGQPVVFYMEACRALWLLGSKVLEPASGDAAAAGSGAAGGGGAAAAALPHLPAYAPASAQRLRSAAACVLYASGLLAPCAEDRAMGPTVAFSVVTLAGSTLCHQCLPTDYSVGELKSLLCYQGNTRKPSYLRLICGMGAPREMKDEEPLSSFSLQGEKVRVIFRLRGGG